MIAAYNYTGSPDAHVSVPQSQILSISVARDWRARRGAFVANSKIRNTSLLSLYAVAGGGVKGFLDKIYVVYRDILRGIQMVRNIAPYRLDWTGLQDLHRYCGAIQMTRNVAPCGLLPLFLWVLGALCGSKTRLHQ